MLLFFEKEGERGRGRKKREEEEKKAGGEKIEKQRDGERYGQTEAEAESLKCLKISVLFYSGPHNHVTSKNTVPGCRTKERHPIEESSNPLQY